MILATNGLIHEISVSFLVIRTTAPVHYFLILASVSSPVIPAWFHRAILRQLDCRVQNPSASNPFVIAFTYSPYFQKKYLYCKLSSRRPPIKFFQEDMFIGLSFFRLSLSRLCLRAYTYEYRMDSKTPVPIPNNH
jgi:hypothetical protein